MNLTPLLTAPLIIKVHAFAAMLALVIGVVQFVAPKGTVPHRWLGWSWFVLIMTMLLTAPAIHGSSVQSVLDPSLCYLPGKTLFWNVRCAGIHLLTLYLLLVVPAVPLLARTGYVAIHRNAMISIWCAALLVAGLFTFDTGRTMNKVIFGTKVQMSSSNHQ